MAKQILSVNYEKLPLSSDCLKGMQMNICDQQFLKRIMDRQDEISQEFIKTTYELFAQDITNSMKGMIDDLKIDLKLLHAEIKDIKADIKLLHIIAETNQAAIKTINMRIGEIEKSMVDHEFRLTHLEKHTNL